MPQRVIFGRGAFVLGTALLSLSAGPLACKTTQLAAPLVEPAEGEVVRGSPGFLETELDRNLPIPGPMVEKLCERLDAPTSCAALYQMSISSGTTDTLASWQREDLNFHLDCLPETAKSFLRSCHDQELSEAKRETACWNVIGLTRARLLDILLAEDERPETASLKEAHQLFALQFEPEKNTAALSELVERILARDPRNLDAHRLRVQLEASELIAGESPPTLQNSLRWLLASSAREHHLIAWQAQSLELELALQKEANPAALSALEDISRKMKKADPSNAWTLRTQAVLAFYQQKAESALSLMQKASQAPEADALMGEELKKIGSRVEHPFEPRPSTL